MFKLMDKKILTFKPQVKLFSLSIPMQYRDMLLLISPNKNISVSGDGSEKALRY